MLIPVLIPYGGDVMDAIGMNLLPHNYRTLIVRFFKEVIQKRVEDKSGRQKDLLNIMG